MARRLPPLVLIALLLVAALAGCTTTHVRTLPVALPLPARPVLQPVPASSVACLSDTTYTALVHRERALRTWGLQLQAVIQANNQHAHQGH